jgi:3-phosphoshikimate 1-carboxyvinyltransferase
MSDSHMIEPLTGPPDATVSVPGSKSITNRALVCAAQADGTSTLEGALLADDTEAMIDCLGALGISVGVAADGTTVTVNGRGGAFPVDDAHLDVRLSGTTARFITPVAATGRRGFTVDGGAPMRRRPMGPMIDALRSVGVTIDELGDPGCLPIRVDASGLHSRRVRVSGDVSSQFLSGLLLAGFEVDLTTDLVSEPYVRMTRAVIDAFGSARTYEIEPDASAASYFLAAAAVCDGRVTVEGLGSSSLQGDLAFVDVLQFMGAGVECDDRGTSVHGKGSLRGIDVDLRHLSDMVPTLAAVAVFADSPTTIRGVGFIRSKESDRIAAVVTELRRCGIDATETDDGLVINPGTPRPARIETYDDHRIAMAFALIGLRVPGIEIVDPDCVAKTFPGYFEALERLR